MIKGKYFYYISPSRRGIPIKRFSSK